MTLGQGNALPAVWHHCWTIREDASWSLWGPGRPGRGARRMGHLRAEVFQDVSVDADSI